MPDLRDMFSDKITIDLETEEIVEDDKIVSQQQGNTVLNKDETKSTIQNVVPPQIQGELITIDDEEDDTIDIDDEDTSKSEDNKDKKDVKSESENNSIVKDVDEDLNNENEDDQFVEVVRDLHQEFFPDATDEEVAEAKDWEGVKKLMASQFKAELEAREQALKQDALNILIKEGYVDPTQVKKDTAIITFEKDKIKDDINLQKDIIRASLQRKGLDNKAIETFISAELDLEERAGIEYDNLVEIDKKNKQNAAEALAKEEEQRKKANTEFTQNLKKEVKGLSDLLPNRKLDDKKQQELLLNMNNTLNKIDKNPAKYYAMLSYLDDLGILDGKFDAVLKTGESIGVKKIEGILSSKKASSGSKKLPRGESFKLSNDDIPSIYG